MTTDLAQWISANGIAEVECIVPDMNGIIRGKVVPAPKFLRMVEDRSLRIPSSIFVVTVTGDYPEDASLSAVDADVVLVPDATTIRVAPGYKTPTAYVITDAFHADGKPVAIAPRQVLKEVIAALCRAWLAAGRRPRARVLPHRDQHRSRPAAAVADRPLGPRRDDQRALRPRSRKRVRGSDRRAVRLRREGQAGDRHADP